MLALSIISTAFIGMHIIISIFVDCVEHEPEVGVIIFNSLVRLIIWAVPIITIWLLFMRG